ncbi:hypothetical protein C7M61_003346 [Candidozyma pseudohaemuli]|uniref:DUF2423 domain-containing protein n=1 Tax=Candidozyma pseudohaemuli TaxID=418784 RepID=A0A2P7YNV2_9ASCO|nr:hypothetical protein C7M61_003346 [[Candida] pseudohaemulonii]PSK37639.1 hypothetical protein C7M61_003346 [[Candida] pseudohaemulonii]
MAKSLRSKLKLRAKSVKRKGEFTDFVNERTARLAARAQAAQEKQKQKNEDAMEEEEEKPEKPKEDLKKVSTSGLKNTSRIRKRGLKKRGHTKISQVFEMVIDTAGSSGMS